MKYVLYRSLGKLGQNVKKHELVAVEYGSSIHDVTMELIKDVIDELKEDAAFRGCDATAIAPKRVWGREDIHPYQYVLTGIVVPPHAKQNILIEFGVIEQREEQEQ